MKFAPALLALGMLAACSVSPDNRSEFRPGVGVVQGVRPVRVALADGYQLTLRMDDGSIQRVTQDSPTFQVGDRVQVTPDGRFFKTATVVTPAPAATVVTPAPAATVATPAPAPTVVTPAPAAPVVIAQAYRPGLGTVESASVVSLPSVNSATAGATAGAATNATMAYRLRMLDGTMQSVVQEGERFELGERVRLTADGRLVRP
jgi:outer membrane lipoprotein SlyB